MRGLPSFANFFTGAFRGRLAYICTIRIAQLCCFLIAGITAFLLRFEFSIPREMLPALWIGAAVWVVTKVVVFHLFGLGRGMWRYFGTSDLLLVTKANAVASALAAAAILAGLPVVLPAIRPDRGFPDFPAAFRRRSRGHPHGTGDCIAHHFRPAGSGVHLRRRRGRSVASVRGTPEWGVRACGVRFHRR